MNSGNYLLIDGVLRPDALRQLYQRGEPLSIKPLFLSTRWEALKEQGPILVQAHAPSRLMEEWRTSPAQHLDASALYSPAPAQTVAEHLRRFIAPPDHLGQCSLLRFADPVVLHHWLSSYSGDNLTRLLGPIEHLWVREPVHTWQSAPRAPFTSFTRQGPPRAWTPDAALLAEAQLTALKQASWWLYKERLYKWLNALDASTFADKTGSQVDSWLTHALDGAEQWGLYTQYGIAIWAELSQLWGLDFMDVKDGPYQQWLSEHPEETRLAPEMRIEALDRFRGRLHRPAHSE